jgi:hypothetical protein
MSHQTGWLSRTVALGLSPFFVLAGCTALPPDALQTKEGQYLAGKACDPIAPDQCGMPFPSNVYLVHDSKGRHVEFGAQTLPVAQGDYTNPEPWRTSDGFSTGQAAMTYLKGATTVGLPTPASADTIKASLDANNPTVLIEADTGKKIAHFAELDYSVTDGSPTSEHLLLIRPVYRLKDSTRYIVAIRNVKDADGKALPPSAAFKALRDGTSSTDPSVDARRQLYENIFAKLAKAGVAKGDLQIAWDYTTASKENNTASMIALRDDALRVVGADGPEYTIPDHPVNTAPATATDTDIISGITMHPNDHIAMRIEGTMHVPLYLTVPNPPQVPTDPQCRLVRDEKGLPKQNGFADYAFEVQIPNSVVAAGVPAVVVQNGHGLLGSRHEGHDGYMARMADDKHYISLAVNLAGFDHFAVPAAENAVQGDISSFLNMVDPQHQGLVNELLAMRMMWRMAKDPRFFFNAQGQPDPNGHSLIDATNDPAHQTHFYRGDSQGGIMGTTYMAISTDVRRGVLGEPGMPYNLLLNRSKDFSGYFSLLQATYTNRGGRDIQIVLALMQMLWDRTEPNGYAPYINEEMLPNTPQHQVLLNVAIGDFQVSPLGAHIIARAVHAKNVGPVNREIYDVPSSDVPFEGSGITEFNFNLDKQSGVALPLVNIANNGPETCDPHDSVREESPVFNQSDLFFRTGTIRNFCTGAQLTKKAGDYCSFDETAGPSPEQLLESTGAAHACTPG